MKLRDRLTTMNPGLHALVAILDVLIQQVNYLTTAVFVGDSAHKANDPYPVTAANASSGVGVDSVVDLEQDLDVKYAAHLGSTSYHIAADSTNTLTAKTVYYKIKALADELKAKYNLHHVYTAGSVHAGSGDPNTVTAGDVSSKATSITLLNQIKAMFNLHCANVTSCHGAADTTNPVVLADLLVTATWTQIAAMADAIRTAYEAHRVLTAGSVHGGADATNTMSAAAVGTLQTSINTYLTELKGDYNAHIIYMTSHYKPTGDLAATAANATSLATSITLANQLKLMYNDHISDAAEVNLVPTLDEL